MAAARLAHATQPQRLPVAHSLCETTQCMQPTVQQHTSARSMRRRQPSGVCYLPCCMRSSQNIPVTVNDGITVVLAPHDQRVPIHSHLGPRADGRCGCAARCGLTANVAAPRDGLTADAAVPRDGPMADAVGRAMAQWLMRCAARWLVRLCRAMA